MRSKLAYLLIAAAAGCASHPAPPPVTQPDVRIFTVGSAPVPAANQLTRTSVYESSNVVSQVLRLAPGAEIATHHHPVHDETFVIHAGSIDVTLNGEARHLGAGTVVHIPANTVIAGRNSGTVETVLVVVFATTGKPGQLTVAGPPHH